MYGDTRKRRTGFCLKTNNLAIRWKQYRSNRKVKKLFRKTIAMISSVTSREIWYIQVGRPPYGIPTLPMSPWGAI